MSESMISISIIIPVYKVEQHIRRCLESVFTQETKDANVECILVDDCSPDHSIEIAREMANGYSGNIRFRFLKHKMNSGVSAARNTGLKEATGDYILFADSDDYLLDGSLRLFTDSQHQYPDADIIVGNVIQNGRPFFSNMASDRLLVDANDFTKHVLCGQIYQQAWNKLVRRSILTDNGITFIEDAIYEDVPWSYEVFSHASTVVLLNSCTYSYEFVESSLVHTIFTPEKADSTVRSCTKVTMKMLANPPLQKHLKRDIIIDYLLCIAGPVNQGMDVLMRCDISTESRAAFLYARKQLLKCAINNGQILIAAFILLSFSPLCYLQKFGWFRHNYYNLQQVTRRISYRLYGLLHHKSAN